MSFTEAGSFGLERGAINRSGSNSALRHCDCAEDIKEPLPDDGHVYACRARRAPAGSEQPFDRLIDEAPSTAHHRSKRGMKRR